MNKLTSNRGFWLTLLLSIITFGIYYYYLIYSFARETNIACKEDNKKTTGLFLFILLSLLTFGIYGIVWCCMWINRCNEYLRKNNKPEGLQVSTFILTLLLLGWITFGIMHLVVFCKMLYLQNAVNSTYNELNNTANIGTENISDSPSPGQGAEDNITKSAVDSLDSRNSAYSGTTKIKSNIAIIIIPIAAILVVGIVVFFLLRQKNAGVQATEIDLSTVIEKNDSQLTEPEPQLPPVSINVIPALPDPNSGKVYRLQVGSFPVGDNEINTVIEKLRSAGFSPDIEHASLSIGEYDRVIISNVSAPNVYNTIQRLEAVGIPEVLIRD